MTVLASLGARAQSGSVCMVGRILTFQCFAELMEAAPHFGAQADGRAVTGRRDAIPPLFFFPWPAVSPDIGSSQIEIC